MHPRLPDRWDLGLSGEIETPDAPVVSDCGGIFHLGTVCFQRSRTPTDRPHSTDGHADKQEVGWRAKVQPDGGEPSASPMSVSQTSTATTAMEWGPRCMTV